MTSVDAPALARPLDARDVAFRPLATYAVLTGEAAPGDWRGVAARVALSGVLSGTVLAVLATRRVTFELVLSVFLYWSFVPLLQLAVGSLLMASSARRPVSLARALDLFFAGHLPWSLWLMAIAGVAMLAPVPISAPILTALMASALAPIVWTVVIVVAFNRIVLQVPVAAAIARALLHQAVLWGSALLFFIWLTDSWIRVMGILGW